MKRDDKKISTLFSPDLAEAGITVAKVAAGVVIAGLGAPPGTDSAAVALMDSVLRPFTGRRYALFVTGILERLQTLEKSFNDIATPDNEHFATIFMTAAREAMVTHEREKVEALQNAVVNTAVGIEIDEELQLIHLSIIGQLSVSHIRILQFAARYFQGCEDLPASISPMEVAVYVFGCQMTSPMNEQLRRTEAIAECLTADLYGKGLLREKADQLHPTYNGEDFMFVDKRPKRADSYEITPLGTSFIQYLSSKHKHEESAQAAEAPSIPG